MIHLRLPTLPLSLLPIPALLLLMAVLDIAVAPTVFYDPPWLVFIGNTLFVGGIGFLVAGIAWRNYAATGRLQVLLLGCAMLATGLAGILAGWVRGFPDGANLTVTIHNTGSLLGAALHVVAALILSAGLATEAAPERRTTWLSLGYGGAVLFMAALTAAGIAGALPPFFVQGVGPTPLRQQVLGGAAWLFAFAAVVFMASYMRSRERFLYWYAGALALTAISLVAIFVQQSVGSPVGWVGRGALYLAGIYFLVSLIVAERSAKERGTSFDDVIAGALTGVEDKFRAAFTNAAVGFSLTTGDGRYVDANPAFCALTGYGLDELRTLTSRELVHPDDRAAHAAATARMLAGEAADFTGEIRYLCKGDRVVWVRESVSLVRDPHGMPPWVMAIVEDIGERRQAEAALRESQARLQSEAAALVRLNEASSRLWTIRDLDTGLGEVLAAAIDLLGADMGHVRLLDEQRGTMRLAAHSGFRQDYLDFLQQLSASEETGGARALRARRRVVIEDVEADTAFAPYRSVARAAGYRAVQSTPLIGHDGKPLGMISTHFRSAYRPSQEDLRRLDLYARQAADFIERCRMEEARRQAEEQRQILQAELFRASRLSEIGRMAAALAHELNQPLTAVTTYLGGCRRMLATGTPDAERDRKVKDVMAQAATQALRAGEIIRRLREFIGAGERERRIEDAATVMREACTLAVTTARLNGAAVTSNIDETGRILVDKIQFQQVIVNLARNAIEAMETSPRKELGFTLTDKGDRVEVSVSDTGGGIDPAIVGRLFRPFSTTKTGGMGIGLSVCREIVEAHDGKIWMEPNPGGGTIFRFTLPIVAEPVIEASGVAAVEPR